jgi:hypothetical protein
MSGEKNGFTVTDKRHFTPEGESRGSETPVRRPSESEMPTGHETGHPQVIDFSGFLLGLAAQASVLLRDPSASEEAEGLPAPDPDAARRIISILEMLLGKTEGRRTDEESGLLDTILFELRLAFVERTRRGAA